MDMNRIGIEPLPGTVSATSVFSEEELTFQGRPLSVDDVREVLQLLHTALPNKNKLITKEQFRRLINQLMAQNHLLAKTVADLSQRNGVMGEVLETLLKQKLEAGEALPDIPGFAPLTPAEASNG